MSIDLFDNPFFVKTPDDMDPETVINLFVDVLSDFPKVLGEGHVFIHGPRGSGKSMIFRYLRPDCQTLVKNITIKELKCFGVYVPIKKTSLILTEIKRLDDMHASSVINEHLLTMHVLSRLFVTFKTLNKKQLGNVDSKEIKNFCNNTFFTLFKNCGCNEDFPDISSKNNIRNIFEILENFVLEYYNKVNSYVKRLSFMEDAVKYNGPLCGYLDFLYPVLVALKKLSFMPSAPIYLLIDDADLLNVTQTKILNSWVSSRTSSEVSLKISTQMKYKTFRTITSDMIECPHDFSEIYISTVYTASPKFKYKEHIKAIIQKRLNKHGINIEVEKFFPVDLEQEKQIKKIANVYISNWEKTGRGANINDDAYRYARPDYIKSLGGMKKKSYTYSYAGFEQLVHISSGVIRNFIEAAAQMYSETQSKIQEAVKEIPISIQNLVVRRLSDEFMFREFDRMLDDQDVENGLEKNKIIKLKNLIKALGSAFHLILISDRSERRVFSVAIAGELDEEVRKIFSLGCEKGYFHKSSIGDKNGTGRTDLYILSRRLAPHFKLDPSSFAGYLFISNDNLRQAMNDPKALEDMIKNKKYCESLEIEQMELFK